MNRFSDISATAIAALFISVLVFLHVPIQVYLGNALEFISAPGILLPALLKATLISTAILFVPVLAPGRKWRRAWSTTLTGLFIALWVSGSFLVLNAGEFDGASFDISRHSSSMTWHSLVFIAVLAACCFIAFRHPKQARPGVIIIGCGLVLLSAYGYHAAQKPGTRQFSPISIDELARFSTDRNLLIIMMDSFQSDAFSGLVAQDPELASALDGFRYFPDTLGVAPSTYLTMPAFHSGVPYRNDMSVQEFYERHVRNGSFLGELAENGYQVDLINPITGVCPAGSSLCSRQENLLLNLAEITATESLKLIDLGIFRAIPGWFKHWLFDGTNGPMVRMSSQVALTGLELRIFLGNRVLETMAEHMKADEAAPTARLIHLLNTHPPYMFDGNCSFIGVRRKMNRELMTGQVRCGLTTVIGLLEAMKRLGVYDNSMIILSADTGVGSIWAEEDLSSDFARQHGVSSGQGRLIGGANPLLAIKLPYAQGVLSRSETRAQLTDVPATVCAALEDCSFSSGLDLAGEPGAGRVRLYQYYRWRHDFWGLDHIPGITEYQVDGPLWRAESWKRHFSDPSQVAIRHLDFSANDPVQVFGVGWGEVETNSQGTSKRWAVADEATLYLDLPGDQPFRMRFTVMSARDLDGQALAVEINGHGIGAEEVMDRVHRIGFDVPAGIAGPGPDELVLRFTRLTEPSEEGTRQVSISFFELEILDP